MPEVSVILPTYNRSKLLPVSVKSALGQSFADLEVVIIDDSPDDEGKNIVKNLNDDRIKYIHHNNPKGLSYARNVGIANSSGKYVAFLDDDDSWHPNKIDSQLMVMKSNEEKYGVIFCRYRLVDGNGYPIKEIPAVETGEVFSRVLRANILGVSTALVKKECLDRVGMFDTSLRSCEDWDLWIRLARHYQLGAVDRTLVDISTFGPRMSANKKGMLNGREALFEKHKSEMNPETVAFHSHWLAVNHFLYGDKKKAREYETLAVENDPQTKKYRITRTAFLLGRPLFRQFMKITGRLYE